MATYKIGHVAGNQWYYGTYVSWDGSAVVLGEGVPPKVYSRDFYINSETGDYFQCSVDETTNEVTWSHVGTFRGPKGEVGESGVQGVQGPTGQMYIPHVNDAGYITWTVGDGVNVDSSYIRGPAFKFDYVGTLSEMTTSQASIEAGKAWLVTSGTDSGDVNRCGYIYLRTADGWADPFPFKGDTGPAGAVYVPSVTSDGILTWSNDAGLPNPSSATILGPQGIPGVSIERVVQDTVNTLSGEPNTVSLVMTDSTVSTFTVYNGARGETGVSIQSVTAETISGDNAVNTVTVALTNGMSSSFEIRNGSKGDKGTTWHIGEGITGGHDGIAFPVPSSSMATSLFHVGDFYLNRGTGEYYRCEQISDGVESSWMFIGMLKGDKGELGAFFTNGTAGLRESRYVYDGEQEGFCYYAYDEGKVYVHTAETLYADSAWDSGHLIVGEKGETGEAGAVFVPNIDSGILSWNNNGGYTNPSPINLLTAGANLVCSPTPPEHPHNGMLWVKTAGTVKDINIEALNVVTGSSVPVAPRNGDIWIRD